MLKSFVNAMILLLSFERYKSAMAFIELISVDKLLEYSIVDNDTWNNAPKVNEETS